MGTAEFAPAISDQAVGYAKPGTAVLIVNPSAGGGRSGRVLPEAEEALRKAGIEFRTEPTRNIDHARQLAAQAAAEGALAISLGGDGLVGAVACGLRGTDGTLGVLPGGRGNDFARVVGIPKDLDEAAAIIARGKTASIDLGMVDDKPFIGIASLGFDSIANRHANETKVLKGSLVYAYAALRTISTWRPAHFRLTLDGHERTLTGYTVGVANSKAYGGGMYLAPNARLDDGLLDVVMIKDVSRLKFVGNFPKVFKGEHVDGQAVEVVQARTVKLEADQPFDVYADGDPIGRVPATVTVVPRAVRVIIP
jgi:YegS/Rv2252/BmrU family lipid kinase